MKITESNRDRLIIKDFPWALGLALALLGGGFVVTAIRSAVHGPILAVDVLMFGIVGGLFLLAGAIFAKRSVFIFDLTQQQLTWSRLGLFGWRGGTIAFGRVTGCVVEVMGMSNQAPTSRLTLASPDGNIPLTETYSTGSPTARLEMRRAIHTALGLPPPEPESSVDVDGMIKALLVNGQVIAAIKLVREHRGIGLAEAKAVVDSMK